MARTHNNDENQPKRRRDGDNRADQQRRTKKKNRNKAVPPTGLVLGGILVGLVIVLGVIGVVYKLSGRKNSSGQPFATPDRVPGDLVTSKRGQPTLGPGITVSDRPYVTLANFRKVTINGMTHVELNYTIGEVAYPNVTHVLCVRVGNEQSAAGFEINGPRAGVIKETRGLENSAEPIDAWVETRQNRTAVVVSNVVSID